MEKKVSRFIYWAPRIGSILFIFFLMLFSLDVFDSNLGFWGTVVGLLMHNIPVFILTAVLIIAWRYELVGAIVFSLAGVVYIIMTLTSGILWYIALSWSFTIAGPAFFIGILFFMNWTKKKQP